MYACDERDRQPKQPFLKQTRTTRYHACRVSSYFLARTLSELPNTIIYPAIFSAIVYGMAHLQVRPVPSRRGVVKEVAQAIIAITFILLSILTHIDKTLTNQQPNADRFYFYLVVVILIANCATSVGYLISSMTSHEAVAYALGKYARTPKEFLLCLCALSINQVFRRCLLTPTIHPHQRRSS